MKQIIYVDVLVAVNLFVNYFLLLTVAGFFHISASRLRMVLGRRSGPVVPSGFCFRRCRRLCLF